MSSRLLSAGVVAVALALVVGGMYFAFGEAAEDSRDTDPAPVATRPRATAPPPATAAIGTVAPPTTALLVSSDPDGLFPVPNVVGQPLAIAESRLMAFTPVVEVEMSTEIADFDEVISQTPGPGARLAQGATVEIVYSERPRPETVAADPLDPTTFDVVEPDAVGVGECGVFRVEERVLFYDPIDCVEPHDLQILDRLLLEDGPDKFDATEVNRLLRRQCEPAFFDFVGVTEGDSDAIRLSVIRPNDERYDTEQERNSVCVLLPLSGLRVVGSARDSLW